MNRTYVKPLWNVPLKSGAPVRTTLKAEIAARRYETGRGYLVTADSAKEALQIANRYYLNGRGFPDDVQVHTGRGVPVLMTAPRW